MNLNEFKLITAKEYMDLDNPVFVGQTPADEKGCYYILWECNSIKYKVYQDLFNW